MLRVIRGAVKNMEWIQQRWDFSQQVGRMVGGWVGCLCATPNYNEASSNIYHWFPVGGVSLVLQRSFNCVLFWKIPLIVTIWQYFKCQFTICKQRRFGHELRCCFYCVGSYYCSAHLLVVTEKWEFDPDLEPACVFACSPCVLHRFSQVTHASSHALRLTCDSKSSVLSLR